MSDAAVERKPLNKLALIAFREVQKPFAAAVQEIVEAAAEVDGIDPKEWQFDMKSLSWVKLAAPAE